MPLAERCNLPAQRLRIEGSMVHPNAGDLALQVQIVRQAVFGKGWEHLRGFPNLVGQMAPCCLAAHLLDERL
jgi:hypothetical protein